VSQSIILVAAVLLFAAGTGQPSAGTAAPVAPIMSTGNLTFDTVMLPKPNLDLAEPLMKALKERRSVREYDARPFPISQLANLLWAANGVNREDGRRTAPAAVNQQSVDIYVILPGGAFLYDAPGERLLPVAAGDFRTMAGGQEFVTSAPVNLVFVADPARFKPRPGSGPAIPAEEKLNWSRVAAGAMVQNVGLYCAAERLGNVVRAMVDRERLGPALKLRPDQVIILAQTVGCLKP
jgi:hypothetical protein